jgi:hypothetical protein
MVQTPHVVATLLATILRNMRRSVMQQNQKIQLNFHCIPKEVMVKRDNTWDREQGTLGFAVVNTPKEFMRVAILEISVAMAQLKLAEPAEPSHFEPS